jgi:hypothetical protein
MHRQMMRNFGGFGLDDDFFGGGLKRFGDPFEDMFKFSDSNFFIISFSAPKFT